MRYRFDGFTAEKRKKFLKSLARTGCISDAARVAGISTTTVDRWRRKDAAFSKACDAAIDMASSHIEPLAWERGVIGIEEPVWHHGKQVGTRIKRSDSIFRMLLMASSRKKYGRMGAVHQGEMRRIMRKQIKRELRAEIEEEVRAKLLPRVATNEEVSEALLKALQAFGVRVRAEDAARLNPPPAGEGEEQGDL